MYAKQLSIACTHEAQQQKTLLVLLLLMQRLWGIPWLPQVATRSLEYILVPVSGTCTRYLIRPNLEFVTWYLVNDVPLRTPIIFCPCRYSKNRVFVRTSPELRSTATAAYLSNREQQTQQKYGIYSGICK